MDVSYHCIDLGFSQGMLLPLISIIFETDGVSSTLNGLNATGLYIGTLLISPFVEQPLRKFGYKPIIIGGGAVVFISLLMFPLWKHVVFWFILRLLIGIGDHCLHFATQTWLTSSAPQGKLGKSMAIYGLSFGVGFAVGPLMTPLVRVSESFPFIVSSLLCLMAWSLVFFIQNEHPEVLAGDAKALIVLLDISCLLNMHGLRFCHHLLMEFWKLQSMHYSRFMRFEWIMI
ncbi:hypothetical protein UACE39S_03267 [Ureibacillus acetophenoni]